MTSKPAELKTRQAHYKTQLARLKQAGETQYAEVDPDARLLTKSAQSVAGYNMQIATDAKHKLMVHCDVTADGNDTQQLVPVAQEVKAILDVDTLEVVANAGYYLREQRERFLWKIALPRTFWPWKWKVCFPRSIPISVTSCMMVSSLRK